MAATNSSDFDFASLSEIPALAKTGAIIDSQLSNAWAPTLVIDSELGVVSNTVVAIGQPEQKSDSVIQSAIWAQ